MVTQAQLKEWLSYDPQSGHFAWKKGHSNRTNAGDIAGSIKRGYVVIGLFGNPHQAHRLAWLYVYGVMPNGLVDHINRDKSDNRIANLREANSALNTNNATAPMKGNRHGVRNVLWHKKDQRWVVHFRRAGKFIFHRSFTTFDEAVAVAAQMKRQFHPEAFSSGETQIFN